MTGLRYHLLALAVVAIWGVTFVCTKVLIGAGMDPPRVAAGGGNPMRAASGQARNHE